MIVESRDEVLILRERVRHRDPGVAEAEELLAKAIALGDVLLDLRGVSGESAPWGDSAPRIEWPWPDASAARLAPRVARRTRTWQDPRRPPR